MRGEFGKNGIIRVFPTEEGKKELDALHPFYRVKLLNGTYISDIKEEILL